MGITTYINETNNNKKLVIFDTKRASEYDTVTSSFIPINTFTDTIFTGTGAVATTGAKNLGWTATIGGIVPLTLTAQVLNTLGVVVDTSTDIPSSATQGSWTLGTPGGFIQTGGTPINYDTGIVTVPFTGNLPLGFTVRITGSLPGDYFTGDNTQFFNWTNWRPSDDFTGHLYVTNNKDRVTLYDGTNLSRPAFGITVANVESFTNDITTTLDIKVYQQRLLFIRPTKVAKAFSDSQFVFYNRAFDPDALRAGTYTPFDFAQDISGHGGAISAPTGDWIQSAEFLRDAIVFFFTDSTWLFRFTGNQFDPFRFIQINNSRSCNAPYGSVNYDASCTAMGSKGLVDCDGVNVDRYDFEVIDLWEDINQERFFMCFSQRFDSLNQTWMLYPSESKDNQTSDSVMVYNFLEETWAIFKPNLGNLVQTPTLPNTLSCIGLGFTTKDLVWTDFAPGGAFGALGLNWSQANFAWNANLTQNLSPLLLGGDQNGFVYELNVGPTDNAGPAQALPIITSVKTKQYNPYVQEGMKARFGYLDVYYEVNAEVQVVFNFFLNGSDKEIQTNILTFDSTNPDMDFAWKRIYINLTGQFIQWEISTHLGDTPITGVPIYNTAGTFKILGQILYASPAGRLTPGTYS